MRPALEARPIQPPDTIAVNLAAFLRSLRAEHKSEKTIETYGEAVVQLAAFLAVQRLPDEVRELRREPIDVCDGIRQALHRGAQPPADR